MPANVIQDYQPFLSNMLGIIRGNVYYNLVNWYRLLACLPVGDTSQFMETMMGVKQVRHGHCNISEIFADVDTTC